MSLRRWLCSCAIVAGLAGGAGLALAEDLNVQVRETPVREKAHPLSNILGTLRYGDKVLVLEKLGEGWKRVEHSAPSKLAGWVRSSALTPKSLDTTNFGGSKSSATTVETTEAGKGLLEKGEQAYVDKHNLQGAMSQLDALEKNPKLNASPAEIQSFLSQGGVTPREGK